MRKESYLIIKNLIFQVSKTRSFFYFSVKKELILALDFTWISQLFPLAFTPSWPLKEHSFKAVLLKCLLLIHQSTKINTKPLNFKKFKTEFTSMKGELFRYPFISKIITF